MSDARPEFNAENVSRVAKEARNVQLRAAWVDEEASFKEFLNEHESKIWEAAARGDFAYIVEPFPKYHSYIQMKLVELGFRACTRDQNGNPLFRIMLLL